jgi:hypothetical protein
LVGGGDGIWAGYGVRAGTVREGFEEERYLRSREHYRLRKFNLSMDEVRIAKLRGERVRTWPVWFIEDYLAGGQEQVWGPEENYHEYGQAAAGFERS